MKTCVASCTPREITPSKIATPSKIDTQERIVRKIPKKVIKKKEEDNHEDKGFQKSRGTVAVIFAGIQDSRSKHQEKLALRTIMAAEPATPRYLNWSEYPIQFSREDQWTSVGNAGHYPLVLDPTIAGMTIMKVLIDGGAGLNIIFSETLGRWDYNSPG